MPPLSIILKKRSGCPIDLKKFFKGTIIDGFEEKQGEVIYNVRNAVDDDSTFPDLSRLEKQAARGGYLKKAEVGLGVVTRISCRDLFALAVSGIKKDPWYLAKGFTKIT